jgi:hypothetical protein
MPNRYANTPNAVESRILSLRHQRVILDADLAELYGVPVKRLNEQVKRNQERFPSDFMFQLNSKEHDCLRSQFATSNKSRGGRRYAPHAFTEHGAIMAATVLNSKRAVQMSVFVVRAFVRLREMLATSRRLAGNRRTGKSPKKPRFRDYRSLYNYQRSGDAEEKTRPADWLSTSTHQRKQSEATPEASTPGLAVPGDALQFQRARPELNRSFHQHPDPAGRAPARPSSAVPQIRSHRFWRPRSPHRTDAR